MYAHSQRMNSRELVFTSNLSGIKEFSVDDGGSGISIPNEELSCRIKSQKTMLIGSTTIVHCAKHNAAQKFTP